MAGLQKPLLKVIYTFADSLGGGVSYLWRALRRCANTAIVNKDVTG